jgi:hypothetical protein
MAFAVRPKNSEVAALLYMHKRFVLALRRRGLKVGKTATKAEIEKANTVKLFIDKVTGQQRLF